MISSFSGYYRWLSNFWPATVVFAGRVYPTVEHAYHAGKTEDADERERLRTTHGAGRAKQLGQRVTLRPDWEKIKLAHMENLLRQKFTSGTVLAGLLRATAPHELVEGNYWGDIYWGVCNGLGENHLGKLLMTIRKDLQ